MRKLRPAERRFLEAIPKDLHTDQLHIEGVLLPYEFPKGVSYKTVFNLKKMGMIRVGKAWINNYPLTLTDKGKAAIGRN